MAYEPTNNSDPEPGQAIPVNETDTTVPDKNIYEPTLWKDGDIVTAERLNKLEQGVTNAENSGGTLAVGIVNGAFDKTWKEIHDAIASGFQVSIYYGTTEDNDLCGTGLIVCAGNTMIQSANAYYVVVLSVAVSEEAGGLLADTNASVMTTNSPTGYIVIPG